MIIELRFELLVPRQVRAAEERLEKLLPERNKLSPLGGLWKVEVGTVDQLVSIWAYDDLAHRDRVLAQSEKIGWNTVIDDLIMEQRIQILTPTPFSPPIEPKTFGQIYELRMYTYKAGMIPTITERWQAKIEDRVKLSPIVLCGSTQFGLTSQWVHLWAYKDVAERQHLRAESLRLGIWPPDATIGLLKQDNMLLIPSRLSPLQ